jgi:hypothetical protein
MAWRAPMHPAAAGGLQLRLRCACCCLQCCAPPEASTAHLQRAGPVAPACRWTTPGAAATSPRGCRRCHRARATCTTGTSATTGARLAGCSRAAAWWTPASTSGLHSLRRLHHACAALVVTGRAPCAAASQRQAQPHGALPASNGITPLPGAGTYSCSTAPSGGPSCQPTPAAPCTGPTHSPGAHTRGKAGRREPSAPWLLRWRQPWQQPCLDHRSRVEPHQELPPPHAAASKAMSRSLARPSAARGRPGGATPPPTGAPTLMCSHTPSASTRRRCRRVAGCLGVGVAAAPSEMQALVEWSALRPRQARMHAAQIHAAIRGLDQHCRSGARLQPHSLAMRSTAVVPCWHHHPCRRR